MVIGQACEKKSIESSEYTVYTHSAERAFTLLYLVLVYREVGSLYERILTVIADGIRFVGDIADIYIAQSGPGSYLYLRRLRRHLGPAAGLHHCAFLQVRVRDHAAHNPLRVLYPL